jgi:hypothetical protein
MTKEQLREEFKDFMCKAEVPGRSTNEIINFWLAKFSQARKEAVEGERERIEKIVNEKSYYLPTFSESRTENGGSDVIEKNDILQALHPHSKDEMM